MKIVIFSLLLVLSPALCIGAGKVSTPNVKMAGAITNNSTPELRPVNPYALLGISPNASDSAILGVPSVSQTTLNQIKVGLINYQTFYPIKNSYLTLRSIWTPETIDSSSAQEILKKNGFITPQEQRRAAEAVTQLLEHTYNKYTAAY